MDKRTTREVEAHGTTVEAAIAEGLRMLSLNRDQVDIQIVDEGSRGLLGIGSREAVVRLRPARSRAEAPPPPAAKPEPAPVAQPAPSPKPAPQPKEPKPAKPAAAKPAPRPAAKENAERSHTTTDESLAAEREAAVAILTELLDKMRVEAEVTANVSEPDDVTGQRINVIDITGDDLSVLIGPRGETLDALQFLSRLMVAHQLQQRAYFVIDVEGYRERRQQALTRLAERMADKAKERNQPVSLEPMSSYERRVIHMALRDSPDVYTESTGEGKYRKVRIYPKS
jgi:spoIIIJ-associated protein